MSPGSRERTVRPGEPVPEFSGTTSAGGTVTSADLLGRPAVVYFYPKAGSLGCSIEAREFARHLPELAAAGVRVVGVSVDPEDAQERFRKACGLPFELIADHDRAVSLRFGVLGRLGYARRTTFLIGADGKVLEVVRSWRPGAHVRRALERLAASANPLRSTGASTGRHGPGGVP